VKQLHIELLKTRESMWYEKKNDALECMKDLSQNYVGTWVRSELQIYLARHSPVDSLFSFSVTLLIIELIA
jgi:hypothetical protein